MSAVKIINEDRYVNTQSQWYKQIQPTADSGAVAARQLPNITPVWIKMMTDELTVLLFCDVHINKGTTLDSLQCLRVI